MVNKELIKKRFAKNVETYDKNAVVQKHMAEHLMENLFKTRREYDKILEIGCGTGFLTKEILKKLSYSELFLNDIVENSVDNLRFLSDKINKIYGDCEKIVFPNNTDLIISNATFQWVEDFNFLCKKFHSSLNNGGIFAFTTFGENNFYQIKNITKKSLNYYKKEDLENILSEKFKILYSFSEEKNLEFDSVNQLLKHLKFSGVNALEEKGWTKKDLKNFITKYNNAFKGENDKLLLTYHPLYFICAKINFCEDCENE